MSARRMIVLPDSGIGGIWAPAQVAEPRPLLVCIHGGGYCGRYFDVPGASLVEAANRGGFDVFSIDRPDHGVSRRLPKGELLIERNAAALWQAVDELIDREAPDCREVVLIGHSIGGAVALCMAAHPRLMRATLRGVAVSGIALEPVAGSGDFRYWLPPLRKLPMPRWLIAPKLFGPRGTFDRQVAKRSLDLALVWPVVQELLEVDGWWLEAVEEVAREVRVPVDIVLGEFEAIWKPDVESLGRFARLFSRSPRVESEIFKGAGHCIDHHRIGARFQARQLEFLRAQLAEQGAAPSPAALFD